MIPATRRFEHTEQRTVEPIKSPCCLGRDVSGTLPVVVHPRSRGDLVEMVTTMGSEPTSLAVAHGCSAGVVTCFKEKLRNLELLVGNGHVESALESAIRSTSETSVEISLNNCVQMSHLPPEWVEIVEEAFDLLCCVLAPCL